jgi:hypothetical protein
VADNEDGAAQGRRLIATVFNGLRTEPDAAE